MLDTDGTLAATARHATEIAELVDRLGPDDWERPTRLPGWAIKDLVAHVVTSLDCQGQAFRNLATGSTETPPVRPTPAVPGQLPARLRAETEALIAALDAVTADQHGLDVHLPFGTAPVAIGAYVVLAEYALHLDDLRTALGDEQPIDHDTATTLVTVISGWVPTTASQPPADPFAFVLQAGTGTFALVPTADGWTLGDAGDLDRCEVTGDDTAILRFEFGRIESDHPSLTVTGGRATEAKGFKQTFPGP